MSDGKNSADINDLANDFTLHLADRLKNGEEVVDKEGGVHKIKCAPAVLKVILDHLAANNVTAIATPRSPLAKLAAVPFPKV